MKSGPQARVSIAPRVLETIASGEKTEFLVVLGEQADLSPAFAITDRSERGDFTRDSLYRVAETSQAPLRQWLAERDIEHKAFYIVNAIWVNAPAEIAVEIAQRPEVSRIEANPTIQNRLPRFDPVTIEDAAIRLADELRKVSSVAAIEPGVAFIRAPQVWADGFTGQDIVIAGADTGIKWDHPVLKQHYRGWVGGAANHNDNWHDSIHTGGGVCGSNTAAPCDDNGHGTHTVGTALGDDGAGNQVGVAPGAKFIGCRNMDQGNGKPSTYMECMEFFLAPYPIGGTTAQGDPSKRPHITINSWTCPASEGCAPGTLLAAVEAQRAAGIMMVVAAGNEGSTCSSIGQASLGGPPSHYDAPYTVGAVTSTDGLIASFSSRGPITVDASNRVKPDITAPGVSVRSATATDGYAFLNGTSMATPHVAGAVALLWSAEPALRGQIDLTEGVLNGSAVRVNTTECSSTGIPNNVYGYGRLDIKAAVDGTRPAVSQIAYSVAASSSSQTLNVTALSVVSWAAVSNAAWITVTSNPNGSGNGSVSFLIAANPGLTPRIGTLTIA
ncbi:MAG: S8 family serine peptidase, partial [Acidobacteriota bacterium]